MWQTLFSQHYRTVLQASAHDIMKMTSLKHPVQGMDEESVSPDRSVGKVFSCLFFFLSVFIIQELNILKVC